MTFVNLICTLFYINYGVNNLPLKLDKIDTAILKALMVDGRKSFRKIADQVRVSTPTVKSRFERMLETGIITKIAPILDTDKVERGVSALIYLKVELSKLNSVISQLVVSDEVRNVLVTSGEANLVIRVTTPSNEALQSLLDSKIAPLEGVSLMSSQVIIKTAKDEQGLPLFEELVVSLACDTCHDEIKGKPFVLNVAGGKRFFCCKICLSTYKKKYKTRIQKLSTQLKT